MVQLKIDEAGAAVNCGHGKQERSKAREEEASQASAQSCARTQTRGLEPSCRERVQVISALVEGNSINAIVRMTGVAKHTVLKLMGSYPRREKAEQKARERADTVPVLDCEACGALTPGERFRYLRRLGRLRGSRRAESAKPSVAKALRR